MMKRIGLALALVLGVTGSASAQSSASTTADVTAEVLAALQWTAVDNAIDFGIVSPGDGAVTIDPTSGAAGAEFELVGASGQPVIVTFDVQNGQLTDGANTLPMTASVYQDGAQANQASATAVTTGDAVTIDADGAHYFWVGGQINVGGAQPSGTYTGTVNLTVAY